MPQRRVLKQQPFYKFVPEVGLNPSRKGGTAEKYSLIHHLTTWSLKMETKLTRSLLQFLNKSNIFQGDGDRKDLLIVNTETETDEAVIIVPNDH